MREPIPFERNQRLRLGFRGHEREVAVDVIAVHDESLWVDLAEPALWLEDRHLEGGTQLAFWRRGERHVAEAVVVDAFDLDRGRLQLRRPATSKVVQRRKTFRETVEVPVRLAPVDEGPETADMTPREARTQDIGGGGLCIQTAETTGLGVDDELQLELALPMRRVRARGKVRWARRGDDGLTRFGVAFTRIAEREQDTVYGFLFDLQRSRLRAS
jgi:hypothetical protein